jgi:hypothetical protein
MKTPEDVAGQYIYTPFKTKDFSWPRCRVDCLPVPCQPCMARVEI